MSPMRLKSLLNDRIEEVITSGTSGRHSFGWALMTSRTRRQLSFFVADRLAYLSAVVATARTARIRNYRLINDFRKFCELMSARLKRRSRAVVILVVVASRLRPDPFYPTRSSIQPRRGTSPTSTVGTPLPPCRNERAASAARLCDSSSTSSLARSLGEIRHILTADKWEDGGWIELTLETGTPEVI